MIDQITDGSDVTVAFDVVTEDQVVAKHTLSRVGIGKEGIPGKSHASPIDRDEKRHLIFRVAGRTRDLKIILFPFESFAVPKGARHLKGLAQCTTEVVAARVLKDIDHVLIAPTYGQVVACDSGDPVHV